MRASEKVAWEGEVASVTDLKNHPLDPSQLTEEEKEITFYAQILESRKHSATEIEEALKKMPEAARQELYRKADALFDEALEWYRRLH